MLNQDKNFATNGNANKIIKALNPQSQVDLDDKNFLQNEKLIEIAQLIGTRVPLLQDGKIPLNYLMAQVLLHTDVIDNLLSDSATNPLSANMGKELQEQMNNLKSRWRFLSNWDCTTGLPFTNPPEMPYTYETGMFYRISKVAPEGGVNYKPNTGSYTGAASTVVETQEVHLNDLYTYDGTQWITSDEIEKILAIDEFLSLTSLNAVENRVISSKLSKHCEVTIAVEDWDSETLTATKNNAWGVSSNDCIKYSPQLSDLKLGTDFFVVIDSLGENTVTFKCNTIPSEPITMVIESTPKHTWHTLTRLEIQGTPAPQYIGKDIDTTGLTVKAFYYDGTEVDVTSQAVFTPEVWEESGELTLTATYTQDGITKTAPKQVNVADMDLEITGTPVTQIVGFAPIITGLSIKVVYTDGTEVDVTSQATLTPNVWQESGDQILTATHTQDGIIKTATIQVYVSDITLVITGTPVEQTDKSIPNTVGLAVKAVSDDELSSIDVTNDVVFSPERWLEQGTQTLTATLTKGEIVKTKGVQVNVGRYGLVGARIFYIHNDNGATYKFYDSDMNEIVDQTVEGLENAYYYEITDGIPTADKFYVCNTTQWPFSNDGIWAGYSSVVGVNSQAIGSGKSNTKICLKNNSCLSPNSSGDTTIWTWLRDTVNRNGVGGWNDWFIPSVQELIQVRESGLVDWWLYLDPRFWSSSENDIGYAYYVPEARYNPSIKYKLDKIDVFAIRAF